jgi:hypothetical protein
VCERRGDVCLLVDRAFAAKCCRGWIGKAPPSASRSLGVCPWGEIGGAEVSVRASPIAGLVVAWYCVDDRDGGVGRCLAEVDGTVGWRMVSD